MTLSHRNIVAGIVILSLVFLAFQRNEVWTSKISLWTDVVKKTPNKSRVHNSMGNCYALLGRYFEAIAEYEIALKLDPGNTEVYFNLAANYEIVGIMSRALYYYDAFCAKAPADYPDATVRSCDRAREIRGTAGTTR